MALAGSALAMLVAGCAEPLFPVHEPALPGTVVAPPAAGWQTWIILSDGCGFCAGDLRAPDYWVTLLSTDGTVLSASYGRSDVEPHVTYSDAAIGWRPVLDPVFSGTTLYGEHSGGTAEDRPIYVVAAQASRLGASDAKAIGRVIERGLEERRAPREVGLVTDCGMTIVEQWRDGEPLHRAEIGCGNDDGHGWGRIAEQMYALRQWVG
ncbi:MAG TPA: hypothetical protein VM327_05465 [Candidatus Thermoplasmatota archaeon]|nr:hypothetical protein [Candidatus Thermoplasmatota archaeon]